MHRKVYFFANDPSESLGFVRSSVLFLSSRRWRIQTTNSESDAVCPGGANRQSRSLEWESRLGARSAGGWCASIDSRDCRAPSSVSLLATTEEPPGDCFGQSIRFSPCACRSNRPAGFCAPHRAYAVSNSIRDPAVKGDRSDHASLLRAPQSDSSSQRAPRS